MEKWQEEAIKEAGTKYLTDVVISNKAVGKREVAFINELVEIDKENARAIIDKYTDIANMLRYTYGLYRSDVEYFNQYSLQINSVISTSLLIEQHIHDLLYNKDLLLTSNRKTDVERLTDTLQKLEDVKKAYSYFIETEKKIDKDTDVVERFYNSIQQTDDLIDNIKQQIEDAKEQEKKIKNEIKHQEKSDYFIGNLSKEEDFLYLFRGVILNYVTNDLLTGVRQAFFEEYNIIENQKKERIHCLKASSYKYTCEKIEKLMNLAIVNHGKNIISNKMLLAFELFIDLEEKAKQEKYKKVLKKHVKKAFKEMEIEEDKTSMIACCTMSHAEEIMQEMRWFDIE